MGALLTLGFFFTDSNTRNVDWVLGDGTGEIRASVRKRVLFEALGISGRDFEKATDVYRQELLEGESLCLLFG